MKFYIKKFIKHIILTFWVLFLNVYVTIINDRKKLLICASMLSTFVMPAPNHSMYGAFICELQQEKDYDRDELDERVRTNVPLLNAEQKNVYDSLMKVVADWTGGIYFLDTPGGTDIKFMSLILATFRSRSQIALAIASFGIAATLSEGGQTAHSV